METIKDIIGRADLIEHYILGSRLVVPAQAKGEDRLIMADYDMMIFSYRATSDTPDTMLIRISFANRNDPWMSTPVSVSSLGQSDNESVFFLLPKYLIASEALLVEAFNVGSQTAFAELAFHGLVWRSRGRISVAQSPLT
jgi:hypothetical protein